MTEPRAKISKLILHPPVTDFGLGSSETVYLAHEPSLFSDMDWSWDSHEREAFIFPSVSAAESARDLLIANGEMCVTVIIHREAAASNELQLV